MRSISPVQLESESNHRGPLRPSLQTVASHAAGHDPSASRNCARHDGPVAKCIVGYHTGTSPPHTRARPPHSRNCKCQTTPQPPP
eukprot:4296491-Prymnesium_polylepis.1